MENIEKKQTSISWLEDQIKLLSLGESGDIVITKKYFEELITYAKNMHEFEVQQAYGFGRHDYDANPDRDSYKYYNETYEKTTN